MYKKITLLLISIVIISSCTKKETLFTSIDSSTTGITFINRLDSNQDLNILNYLYYYNGSGISAGDFNNDGLADLYFTANQSDDKLYLNTGDFTFSDITAASGIKNSTNWTTGSTTVDINNDGLLDIYISKVGDYNTIKGHNLLFVNQGSTDGIPKFKEAAADYKSR